MRKLLTTLLVASMSVVVFADAEVVTRGEYESRSLKTLQIYQNDDGATGASLELVSDSESPADSDVVGDIKAIGLDSGNAETIYAEIEARSTDVTAGTEDGSLDLQVMKAGTLTTILDLNNTIVEFNIATASVTGTSTADVYIPIKFNGVTYNIPAIE